MWWVNKFGSVSGPYSDEQIRRGIACRQFTKLHKISNDGESWQRLDLTKFWNPFSRGPEIVEESAPLSRPILAITSASDVAVNESKARRSSNRFWTIRNITSVLKRMWRRRRRAK